MARSTVPKGAGAPQGVERAPTTEGGSEPRASAAPRGTRFLAGLALTACLAYLLIAASGRRASLGRSATSRGEPAQGILEKDGALTIHAPSPRKDFREEPWWKVVAFVLLLLLGFFGGHFFLEEQLAPSALPWIAAQNARFDRHTPPVAIVDAGRIDEMFARKEGRFASERLLPMLDAIGSLEPSLRPRVVAFDLAIYHEDADPRRSGVVPNHAALFEAIARFADAQSRLGQGIKVVLGSDGYSVPSVGGLTGSFMRNGWASVRTFEEIESLPERFLISPDDAGLRTLGGEAVAKLGTERGRKPAYYPPPHDYPESLPKPRCFFVNYRLIRRREAITLRLGEDARNPKDWVSKRMFGPDFVKKLRALNGPRVWIVGIAEGNDSDDAIVLDRASGSPSRGVVAKGVYQQAAVVDTLLESPIRHVAWFEALALDLLLSSAAVAFTFASSESGRSPELARRWRLCGLGVAFVAGLFLLALDVGFPETAAPLGGGVLLVAFLYGWRRQSPKTYIDFTTRLRPIRFLDEWRSRNPKAYAALTARLGLLALLAFPVYLAYVLAKRCGVFWLGFPATWLYVFFFEPFIANYLGLHAHDDSHQSRHHNSTERSPTDHVRSHAREAETGS